MHFKSKVKPRLSSHITYENCVQSFVSHVLCTFLLQSHQTSLARMQGAPYILSHVCLAPSWGLTQLLLDSGRAFQLKSVV